MLIHRRTRALVTTVIWGALLAAAPAVHAQSLTLLPAGPEAPPVVVEADFGWPSTSSAPDRAIWEPTVGALTVVYTAHPQRSGLEGMYAQPGDCVMRLVRPDLAGHALQVVRHPDGDLLAFTGRTTQRFRVRLSAGCDTSDR